MDINYLTFIYVMYDCWQTIESLTVYCFGQLVYEMSTGKPLETLHCDNISYTCPQELSIYRLFLYFIVVCTAVNLFKMRLILF